jgi:hypothetical protein
MTRSSSSTSPPTCLEAVVESENSNLDLEGGKKALLDPGAPPTWILVTMRCQAITEEVEGGCWSQGFGTREPLPRRSSGHRD